MTGRKELLSIATAVLLTLLLPSMTSGCAKHPDVNNDEKPDKISFTQNSCTVFVGEEISVPVRYQKFERGIYVDREYDFSANEHGIKFTSSSPDVLSVSAAGIMKGLSEGSSTVSMSSESMKITGQMTVTVEKRGEGPETYTFNQDLTQPLTADMIMVPLGFQSTTIQGLDIDKRGVYYMSWETTDAMRVRAMTSDGTPVGSDMILPSGGHGDGFSIEYDADKVYFWTSGTMADHSENGGYSGGKANGSDVRLICRHEFKAGATEYAEDAVECFYLNDNGCRIVDVDTEHDVMACWTYDGGDYMYVYRLSEIRNAKKMTTKVTRTHNQGKSVEAYNLNTITPMAKFSWKRKGVTTGDTNSGAVQGLCVYDDKIYVVSGAKNDEATLVSVLDFNGNILQKLVKLGVTVDKQQLIKLNLSSDGTFEPEGVHIHKGKMYLGFVGDYPTSGSKKHACIIRLK